MGYLHRKRVYELHSLGLDDHEIRHKITQEFGIRLTVNQIEKIYNTASEDGPKKEVERSKRLSKIIEEIIKRSTVSLKAGAISAKIRSIHDERVTKSEINKIIFKELRDKVVYNSYLFTYKWKTQDKINSTLQSTDEIVQRKIESLIGDFDEIELNEELRVLFKDRLIQVSTGIEKIDYLIKSVVKDNIITDCEEVFLKSKAKEFGYSEDIISDAKISLKKNNPYLDNLIHIIFDDGLITSEELIFLKEKAIENDFTESFINERFWTIGLAEYLHHLIKNKPLDEILTLAYFYLKLNSTEDKFLKLHQELNIFSSTDISYIASGYISRLKKVINEELEAEFGLKYNYAGFILGKFTLAEKETNEEITLDPSSIPKFKLEKFMKLLNQERLRIGSPDVNLLVENINYRIENDLWD
jgi:hypothetical protein